MTWCFSTKHQNVDRASLWSDVKWSDWCIPQCPRQCLGSVAKVLPSKKRGMGKRRYLRMCWEWSTWIRWWWWWWWWWWGWYSTISLQERHDSAKWIEKKINKTTPDNYSTHNEFTTHPLCNHHWLDALSNLGSTWAKWAISSLTRICCPFPITGFSWWSWHENQVNGEKIQWQSRKGRCGPSYKLYARF